MPRYSRTKRDKHTSYRKRSFKRSKKHSSRTRSYRKRSYKRSSRARSYRKRSYKRYSKTRSPRSYGRTSSSSRSSYSSYSSPSGYSYTPPPYVPPTSSPPPPPKPQPSYYYSMPSATFQERWEDKSTLHCPKDDELKEICINDPTLTEAYGYAMKRNAGIDIGNEGQRKIRQAMLRVHPDKISNPSHPLNKYKDCGRDVVNYCAAMLT